MSEKVVEKMLIMQTKLKSVSCLALASVAQLVGALSHEPEGRGFNPQSGQAHAYVVGSVYHQDVFGTQPIEVSLALLFPFLSLNVFLGEDKKKSILS